MWKFFFVLVIFTLIAQLSAADDDCKDNSDYCAEWAKNGFCEKCHYACEVREKFCAKTCKFCGDDKVECKDCTTTEAPSTVTTTVVTTTLTTTTPDKNCVDSGANCKNWVRNGFCTNPYYKCADRKKFCAKSCHLCSPTACS